MRRPKTTAPENALLPIRPPPRPPLVIALPERNGPGISKELALAKVASISASYTTTQRNDAEAAHREGTFFRELWVNRAETLWMDDPEAKPTLKGFLTWAKKATGVPTSTIRDHMEFAAIATAEEALWGIGKCKAGHIIAHCLQVKFRDLLDDRKIEPLIGRPLHFQTATVAELEELCEALVNPPPALPDPEEQKDAKVRRYQAAVERTREVHPAIDELHPRVNKYAGVVTVKHDEATTRAHFEALEHLYGLLKTR